MHVQQILLDAGPYPDHPNLIIIGIGDDVILTGVNISMPRSQKAQSFDKIQR